jgi:hypothetical protein
MKDQGLSVELPAEEVVVLIVFGVVLATFLPILLSLKLHLGFLEVMKG